MKIFRISLLAFILLLIWLGATGCEPETRDHSVTVRKIVQISGSGKMHQFSARRIPSGKIQIYLVPFPVEVGDTLGLDNDGKIR